MTERMDAVANSSRQEASRLVLLSGHDTTIMPVLVTLIGDRMDRWPTYVANVVRPSLHARAPALQRQCCIQLLAVVRPSVHPPDGSSVA